MSDSVIGRYSDRRSVASPSVIGRYRFTSKRVFLTDTVLPVRE